MGCVFSEASRIPPPYFSGSTHPEVARSNSKEKRLQDSYLLVNVFLRAGANDFSKLQVRERYAPFPKRFLKRIVNVLQ